MKINNLKTLVVVLSLLFLILCSSCSIKPLEFKNVHEINLSSQEKDELTVSFNIKIVNPNFFKIKTSYTKLDLLYNTTPLITIQLMEPIAVEGKFNGEKRVNFKIIKKAPNYFVIISNLATKAIFDNSFEKEFIFKGVSVLNALGIQKEIKIELKQKINLKELI